MNWYEECIEPEIRELVKKLRDNGINTVGSCGHEMWIECESYDSTTEISTVYNVMCELGIEAYTVTVTANHPLSAVWTHYMRIEIHNSKK